MGRPRSFDTQTVLDAVAGEFRVHGFSETSTEQLCKAAGLQRSSLYNTFTSKEGLFVQALERYTNVMMDIQSAVLTDGDLDGGSRLRRAMEMIVEEECHARTHGHAAGCMSVHAYMNPDLRASDGRVQAILDRDLDRRLTLLTQVARLGQSDGTVRQNTPPEDIAMLIVTLISGLRVAAQAIASPEQLKRIAAAGLEAVLT